MKCGRCGQSLQSVADLAPHQRTTSCAASDPWGRVVELRRDGKVDTADRVAKKLMGVQGPTMSEETKEKLKAYNEANKEEIKRRRRIKAEISRKLKEKALAPVRARRRAP